MHLEFPGYEPYPCYDHIWRYDDTHVHVHDKFHMTETAASLALLNGKVAYTGLTY